MIVVSGCTPPDSLWNWRADAEIREQSNWVVTKRNGQNNSKTWKLGTYGEVAHCPCL